MKKNQLAAWITAGLMCLSAVLTPFPVKTASAMTILETNVTTASEECTILGVYGSYYSQAQEALDRINEIRREACEDGNVPDPRNSSRTLTASDYVPIKWSADLESIARIRAAEGGLAFSMLSSGHNRLNGKGTFSVSYNGVSSSAEDLAYNWGNSMVSGINQWYEEKNDWVSQATGKVTGHYTSMINPGYKYVGLGDFYTEEAQYPNTLSGQFSATSQKLDETMQDAPTDVMQKIEVSNSYIDSYLLDGLTTVYTDKSTKLTPRVTLVNGSKSLKLWVIDPVEYSSSDHSVATVTSDGVVTGHKNGEAVITVRSAGNVLASTVVTVKCNHSKELLSSIPPTCIREGSKIYHCEVCGGTIEQKIPKVDHNYIYGDADSEGYKTGVCSICQDTIRIIPPTKYTLWWRNSTSESDSYYSAFPGSNPIGSTIYCWIDGVDGDEDYQDMIIESVDESVISVPETAEPNSSYNKLNVLAPGITTITIYPKYNPVLKKTWTVRVGDAGSVDITTADAELSQTSFVYTGKACTPNVSVSYHDVSLKAGTDYTVGYENHIEVGTATVLIQGTGIFSGIIRKDFIITGKETPTPTSGVVPTAAPMWTPGPTLTEEPEPTAAPMWTLKPTLTEEPEPTAPPMWTLKPTLTEEPEPTAAPLWTVRPTPTEEPEPTAPPMWTLKPTLTEEPELTAAPMWTVKPTLTEEPEPTAAPMWTLGPTLTEEPEPTAPPMWTLGPTLTEEPEPTAPPMWTVRPTPGIVRPTSIPVSGTGTPGRPAATPASDTVDLATGTVHNIEALQYQITGISTVSLTGINDNFVTKVEVPETVQLSGKTFTVTAIANNAFKRNKTITDVTIGANVKTIGASAFEGCQKMTRVTIGKGVTKIGSNAFKNCKKLKIIVVRSSKLKKVGKNALKGIRVTTKVQVPAKKFHQYKKLIQNKGQGKKLKIVKM